MRTFIDHTGLAWRVWEVRREHVQGSGPVQHTVAPELENGWLCFVSAAGKRRLARYPDDWMRMSEEQLIALCGHAKTVRTSQPPSGPRARTSDAGAPDDLAPDAGSRADPP